MTEYGTRTVGIDLGDRTSVACIYMPRVVVGWFDFPMTPEGVREAFEGKAFAKVAIEAGAQSGWVTRAFGRGRRAQLRPTGAFSLRPPRHHRHPNKHFRPPHPLPRASPVPSFPNVTANRMKP